jgi:hypothetical protein
MEALRSEARRQGMDAAELAGRVLRAHLGFDILDELGVAGNELGDEEALGIASEELQAERGGRGPSHGRLDG